MFSYEMGLHEPPTEATERGTAVHKALETFYTAEPSERTPERLSCAVTHAIEVAKYPEMIVHAEVEELAHQIFKAEDPTSVTVIRNEQKLEQEVGGYLLRGIIDRVDLESDGTITLVDYKTGKPPNKRDENDRLRALMLYAKLWEEWDGRIVSTVKLLYLRGTDKKRVPIVVAKHVTEAGVSFASARLAAIGDAISTARETGIFGPNVTPLCAYCPFRDRCPEGDTYLLERGK
jgi:putative RecB family exonuclease